MGACHVYKTVVSSLAPEGEEESALAELLNSPVDALAVEVHSSLVQFDEVSFVASPDGTGINDNTLTTGTLPKNWNSGSPNFFAFRYRVEIGDGADDLIDLTITKLGNSLVVVSALSENTGKQVSVKLEIKEYINLAVFSRPDGSEVIQDVYISETKTDLLTEKLSKEIIGPLIGELNSVGAARSGSISTANNNSTASSSGDYNAKNSSDKSGKRSSISNATSGNTSTAINKVRQTLIEESEATEESRSISNSTPSTPPPHDPIRTAASDFESRSTPHGFETPVSGTETPQPPLIPAAPDITSGPDLGNVPHHPSRSNDTPIHTETPPGFEDEYEIRHSMIRRTSRHDIAEPGYPSPYVPIGGDDIYPPGGRNPPLAPFIGSGGPSIGSGDLGPSGNVPGIPNFPSTGNPHQGMHPTLDHPIFQGRRSSRQSGPDGEEVPDSLTRPPGARWDPTGPPGHLPGPRSGFGFGPNRFI